MFELIDSPTNSGTTPNGSMPFQVGRINAMIMGGPFSYYHDHLANIPGFTGVLMAEELQHLDHGVFIPTKDFSTPDPTAMRLGIVQLIARLAEGQLAYVGCMGGIGRTGIFMAALAKIMMEANGYDDEQYGTPIEYVRGHYLKTAVETKDQQDFINNLFVADLAKWAQMI